MIVVLLVVFLFVLTACGPRVPAGDDPQDTAAALRRASTGTQGVQLNLFPDIPPTTIYDQNELVALLEVRNRGVHDLNQEDCWVQITGFDPNIITGGFGLPRSCGENVGVLDGKDIYNQEGGFNQLEFYSSNVRLPDGVFEYSPNLNFVTCYNYQTRANPSVCIDPLLYQIAREQKACDYRRAIVTGGGQGGPVGVSNVNVDMIGGQGASRAIFEINIRNFGNGRVLSPQTDIRSCGDAQLRFTDFDRIAYSVSLSGGSLIDCKPLDGFVRLNNNNGKIICTFNINQASAFETPLLVELDYNYLESQQREIRIIKTPQ